MSDTRPLTRLQWFLVAPYADVLEAFAEDGSLLDDVRTELHAREADADTADAAALARVRALVAEMRGPEANATVARISQYWAGRLDGALAGSAPGQSFSAQLSSELRARDHRCGRHTQIVADCPLCAGFAAPDPPR